MRSLKFAVAAAAVLGSWQVAEVSAQTANQGYLTDTRGDVVKDTYNICWRTPYWTPANATVACDPDLVPKPAPKPAAPAAPAAKPAAPAPAPKPKPAAAAPAAPAA